MFETCRSCRAPLSNREIVTMVVGDVIAGGSVSEVLWLSHPAQCENSVWLEVREKYGERRSLSMSSRRAVSISNLHDVNVIELDLQPCVVLDNAKSSRQIRRITVDVQVIPNLADLKLQFMQTTPPRVTRIGFRAAKSLAV